MNISNGKWKNIWILWHRFLQMVLVANIITIKDYYVIIFYALLKNVPIFVLWIYVISFPINVGLTIVAFLRIRKKIIIIKENS